MMNILLTNDDGFDSPGLKALAAVFGGLGALYLAAPNRQQSGTGHAVSVFEPIKVKPTDVEGAAGAWIIDGTPADCVKLDLNALIADEVGLVVSGVNIGPNLGNDVFYSGTVSAAAEAVMLGVPAIAVSLWSFDLGADFTAAAETARRIALWMREAGLPRSTLLNVNVPPNRADIKGVVLARLGRQIYHNAFEERRDPRGNLYYWLGGRVRETDAAEDTDIFLLRGGYVTVTPLTLDMTDTAALEDYKRSFPAMGF